MLNVNSAYPSQPQLRALGNNEKTPIEKTTTPAFKGCEDNCVSQAIENNTKTANKAANAALITSCATLLPLSVLAYKTHNLSKVAEAFQKDAKPVMEKIGSAAGKVEGLADSAKPIVEDIHGITSGARKSVENISNAVVEATKVIKSEELKGVLNEIQGKIAKIDETEINNTVKSEIKEAFGILTGTLNGKLNEVDPKVIEGAIAKISELNVKGLSDSAIGFIDKLKNLSITIG